MPIDAIADGLLPVVFRRALAFRVVALRAVVLRAAVFRAVVFFAVPVLRDADFERVGACLRAGFRFAVFLAVDFLLPVADRSVRACFPDVRLANHTSVEGSFTESANRTTVSDDRRRKLTCG
ncbi:MAG TPA: hypothetical protein VF147_09030 [Vicinamibacterales bacterium]